MHVTSTPLGDIAETRAVLDVFKNHSYSININSTKSMTGHLLGAAGAIEAIACVKAIEKNIIPPTINFESEDENIDYNLNYTKTQLYFIDIFLQMIIQIIKTIN